MPRINLLTLFPDNLNEKESAQYVFERVWAYNRDNDSFETLRLPCTNCCDQEGYGIYIADKQVGRLQKHWRAYNDLPARERPSWQTYINQWQQVAFEASEQGQYYRKPDPFCTVCNGTGIMENTNGFNGEIDYHNPVQLNFTTSDIWHVQELWDDISITNSRCRCIITPDGDWHDFDFRFAWQEKAQEILKPYNNFKALRIVAHV